jgi:DNA-binding GntR family transcriptional regulator
VKLASKSNIDYVHCELRNSAIAFRLLPGQRLNETTLAKELGVSRTPIREALNRLRDEGFVTWSGGRGFVRKPLDVKEIFDLYELRREIEMAVIRLVVDRATDEQLFRLECSIQMAATENAVTSDEMASLDDDFHEQLIAIAGNIEMRDSLRKANDHVRYVRLMDISDRRLEVLRQYKEIVRSLRERNTQVGMRLMAEHIGLRLDRIVDIVARCYGRMYINTRPRFHPRS